MASTHHPRGKVAFVTGANGITGNALIEHLVRQPTSEWQVSKKMLRFSGPLC